ncbi:lipocalin-like domain-containing protein [Steroidobacter flavus]|uniref:Lipocalin-like domain-containing protein n=1 Tax=Steroidobacter flavus TaxID=1842136 RepID=A0ABV8SYT3_9GAMM
MSRLVVWLAAAMATQVQADTLAGVWRFQKEINTTLNGAPVDIPGPAYEGLLIYTTDGYVSVNLMPKGRAWRVDSAMLSELRQTVGEGSSTGYAGRYEVDVATGTVTHIPSVSLDPADEGRRLARSYVLEGDTLKLSGKWTHEGRELVFTAVWRRER